MRSAGWIPMGWVVVAIAGCSTTARNKELVQGWIEDVVNTGDVSRMDRYVSPDYVEVHDGVRHPVGIDGARDHIEGVRRTYPDLRLTIEQQIADGDWVVTRYTARGTHLGTWLGMKPTGKPVEITGVNIDKVVHGRIVEHGGAANLLEALLRIGAVRVSDPAVEQPSVAPAGAPGVNSPQAPGPPR